MVSLLTLAEAAERLGVRPKTLAQQIRAGRLRGAKVGHIWTVTPAEVERYRRDSLGNPGRKSRGER